MVRISLDGWKDPVRRPRYIVWTAVAVFVLAAVMIVALGVTSTRWFCAEGCHKVQDDAIAAYERSAHSEISCMACHMPVNANPIVFILHKAEALGELYLTVTDNYELPLNAESEVALTMVSEQCTQCHNTEQRPITPSAGIIIDHKVHAEGSVTCAICHNRTAHVENEKPKLKDPKSGKLSHNHEDFMQMTACFRCHSQDKPAGDDETPPGACAACHPKDFDLKPATHEQAGFYPAGHAKLAQVEYARVAEVTGESTSSADAEKKSEAKVAEEKAEKAEADLEEHGGEALPTVESINECSTCHSEKFCSDCHGLPMPHPADFMKGHGDLGKSKPQACSRCHGDAKRFCDECHHGTAMDYEITGAKPWLNAHPDAVRSIGANACFDCHDPTYCANCHVNGPDAVR